MIKYLALFDVDTGASGSEWNDSVYESFINSRIVTLSGLFFEVTNLKDESPRMLFSFMGEFNASEQEVKEQAYEIYNWLDKNFKVVDFTERLIVKS